jgi:hypothetical protein
MKHNSMRPPAATAGVAAGGMLPARDALSLRIQIEALLLDPRGAFRPRPLTLRPVGAAGADDLLVMQVAAQADGSISVVTSEPLEPGQRWLVGGDGTRHEHSQHGHGHEYLLLSCRPGTRPEDGGQACWISVLRPQRAEPAQAGAGQASGPSSPADGA